MLLPATTLVVSPSGGPSRPGETEKQRLLPGLVVAMLVGQREGLPEELTRLSTTGLLRAHEPRQIERWIESACAAGLIMVSADQYRTLTVTPFGRAVIRATFVSHSARQ